MILKKFSKAYAEMISHFVFESEELYDEKLDALKERVIEKKTIDNLNEDEKLKKELLELNKEDRKKFLDIMLNEAAKNFRDDDLKGLNRDLQQMLYEE